MEWNEFKKQFENKNKKEKRSILEDFKKRLNNNERESIAKDYGVHSTTISRFVKDNGLKYIRSAKEWVFEDSFEGQEVGTKEANVEERIEKKDNGDFWVITDGKDTFPITKEKYREIRRDYCDPKGRASRYLKIPEICKKHKIRRKHFLMLQNAFGFIHDDIEYTDEEIEKFGVDPLVEDHLEREKDDFFQKIEEKEIKKIIRENEKYKKKDFFIHKIHDLVTSHFVEFAQIYNPPKLPKLKQKEDVKKDLLLEVPIVDLHLNKLAWHPETGESYDTDIAKERFMYVINDVISKILETNLKDRIEKIIFPIGNDFFNFDDTYGRTTKGTIQRNDDRWQKMYIEGQKILIMGIDLLSQIAPVNVFLVPGNHDWMTSFHSIVNIKSWYRENEDVNVNTNPASRKYVRYGESLIGFTHLDKERKRIFGCMQVEAKKDWSETTFHEWHGAHLHSELSKEDNGVIVRNLASVTGRDDWHFNKGYLSHPRNQSFIWHKEKGQEWMINTEIDLSDEYEECNNRITL